MVNAAHHEGTESEGGQRTEPKSRQRRGLSSGHPCATVEHRLGVMQQAYRHQAALRQQGEIGLNVFVPHRLVVEVHDVRAKPTGGVSLNPVNASSACVAAFVMQEPEAQLTVVACRDEKVSHGAGI